jgi:putative ABC transport system permease protein
MNTQRASSDSAKSKLGRGILSLIWTNLARSKKNVVMSSIGIIIGVGALVFFIGLSEGIKQVVLGRIFLIDQVEVIPPKIGLGAQALGALFGASAENELLTDDLTESFNDIDGLSGVYPKMKFTFPAFGFGGRALLGRDIRGELIADGIDPQLVAEELGPQTIFRDRESLGRCDDQNPCEVGADCIAGQCQPMSCQPPKKRRGESVVDPCPGESYCAKDLKQCLRPIPVLLNPQLLELYNGGLAVALGKGRSLPKIDPSLVQNFIFNVELNRSALMRQRGKSLRRKLQVAGFSNKAMSVGVTLPISYVKKLNRYFTSKEAGSHYHSIILKVKDQKRFPDIVNLVKARGLDLAEKTSNAVQAAQIILSIEAIFTLISLVIVGIASLNISQMFFMMITQRRREIGLLRALGASPQDIQKIILGEATLIGLFGGILGTSVGFFAGKLTDFLAAQLPRFPYKPDSFFIYPWWVWGAGILVAIIFCIFGAYFPARSAANQEPAEALTQ